MKLKSAEFDFGSHKVVFIGAMICIYESDGGRWELVKEMTNKWVSLKREDDGVMGRSYKPRVTDAANILSTFLKATALVKSGKLVKSV